MNAKIELNKILRVGMAGMLLLLIQISTQAKEVFTDSAIVVPLGGNGWLSKGSKAQIGNDGLSNWKDASDIISIYVRLEAAGDLNLALRMQVPEGSSKISVAVGTSIVAKVVDNHLPSTISFGKIRVKAPGYICIRLRGLQKDGKIYAQVSDVLLSGSALASGAVYVKNNNGNYFHWGHRGPSVNLFYSQPEEVKTTAEWFYNEVTVPKGNDVVGSYFMANGFSGGYFGMQVNTLTERHVLFSIWSPFKTDDPKNIPDSLKISLLKKGENVDAGEFGNEGSGGQSSMAYPWVAGKTYAFLLHAEADSRAKTTIFTAYFKPAQENKWQLIASFKRPMSGFYLKGLYSFLENFNPATGAVERRVNFGNAWLISTTGQWYSLNRAVFNGGATATINYRKDYGGGVEGDQFYLRNCGFFSDFTPLGSKFQRSQTKAHPQIDLKNWL